MPAVTEGVGIAVREVLGPDLRQEVARVIDVVGRRLASPEILLAAVSSTTAQTRFPEINRWNSLSVPFGDAGLAVMCSAVAATGEHGWARPAAHRHLVRAAAALATTPPTMQLFGGIPGLAASVAIAGGADEYRVLSSQLTEFALPRIRNAAGLRLSAPGLELTYDLMSGLAGWGAYLSLLPPGTDARRVLRVVTDSLVQRLVGEPDLQALVHPLTEDSDAPPPAHGYLDCGMAHGIAGPVSLLALAILEGHDVGAEGRQALAYAASWLAAQAVTSDARTAWPRVVLLDHSGGLLGPGTLDRPGWCYGTPGIARALWLAGRALGDSGHCDLALRGMRASLSPNEVRRLASPTLCHGLAGLLLISLVFAVDAEDEACLEACRVLCEQLVDLYDEDALLGFRDQEVGGGPVDSPGFLSGAAGIVAVFAAVLGGTVPTFARLLLLA